MLFSLRSQIQRAPSLLWRSEPCHQRYKTPLPLTCSIVWIMLSDHFNRLLGYRFSWVCRMRDEAGSWGGVLKNNTKCSISSLQSRGTGDKLRHTREENIHKNTLTVQYYTHIYTYICILYLTNYLSAPRGPHQPHNLTPIFPLSLFLQSKSFFLHWSTNQSTLQLKPCVGQIVYYPHSLPPLSPYKLKQNE